MKLDARAEAWMRDRLNGMTLEAIAQRDGLTKQRVAQILTAAYGQTGPRVVTETDHDVIAAARAASRDGYSLLSIARTLNVSVGRLRSAGVEPPTANARLVLRRREMLARLDEFVSETGRVPAATDWNRTIAIRRGVPPHDAARWPTLTNVQRAFGSWSAFLIAGGYPALRSGHRSTDPRPLYHEPHPQDAT